MQEFYKDHAVIQATCIKCNHKWSPYGEKFTLLPHIATISCPKCGDSAESHWYDEATKKKLTLRKLGLDGSAEANKKIKDLEKRISILEKENKILREKDELTNAKITQINSWKKDREQDFIAIEELAKEDEEKNEFRKNNR
jgi:hypothetical protein